MSKYIDADRLRAEIAQRFWDYGTPLHDDVVTAKVDEVLSIIDSLQQEQPEVDLVKEYDEEFYNDPVYGKLINRNAGIGVARHFYELGQSIQYQKDRLEFSKLKAKEWKEGFDKGYAKGLNERKENKKIRKGRNYL